MTDSGGFQVFSLGAAFGRNITKIAKGEETARPEEERQQGVAVFDEEVASQHGQLAIIDNEGVTFTSHLDGSLHRFTPERSIEIQHALGADMFFAFDECTSPTEPYEYQREAMERTHKWAARSLKAHRQNLDAARKQAIFGIVQGGRYADLRKESAKEIASPMAKHREVIALDAWMVDVELRKTVETEGADSVKRVKTHVPMDPAAWLDERRGQGLSWIERFLETKTVWHPASL